MKRIGLAVFTAILFGTGWLLAAEPVDSQVKGALYDIEKYEKQFSGQSSANPSTVKRTLKLLGLTRQRLDGSPNKSHPSWIDADTRYKALVSHLNQLLNPTSSAAPPAPATPSASTPRATAPAAPTSAQPMISQYRVRIKKIQRDIESRIDTIDKGGVKPFQDSEYVEKWEKSAAATRESLAKYDAWKSDPDVVKATEGYNKFLNMIKFGKEHAAKEIAELGDVQARLREIEANTRQLSQADTPQIPLSEGELKQWLISLARTRQAAATIYNPLPEIKNRAYLPRNRYTVSQGGPYDLDDVDRLERSLLGLVNSIDSSLKQFSEELNRNAQRTIEGLSHYAEYDPTDRNHQTKHFLVEGRADEIRERLSQEKTNMSEAVEYAQLTKNDSLATFMQARDRVQATIDKYEADHKKALELVRMPEAATKDSKLTSIAKTTLKQYDYVGDIKRMVINADKQHYTKETSEQEFDKAEVSLSGTITLSGTETTYFYEWDQFQVATAEPVGNKHYIFYNTLKYYTSGATTTPLNKWIVSNRIQGAEIPEANISK